MAAWNHLPNAAILFDWMIEVCEEFKWVRETTHLALNFVDRFLSENPNILVKKLQLVGITALFIAAKLEEDNTIKTKYLIDITESAYKKKELHTMEKLMLDSLDWKLWVVTPLHWFQVYCSVGSLEGLIKPQNAPHFEFSLESVYQQVNYDHWRNTNHTPPNKLPLGSVSLFSPSVQFTQSSSPSKSEKEETFLGNSGEGSESLMEMWGEEEVFEESDTEPSHTGLSQEMKNLLCDSDPKGKELSQETTQNMNCPKKMCDNDTHQYSDAKDW
eukprot:CAMPEP_0174265720 /NCGR_PEP_ID=MMETSP0439-20130205/27624_1 /TAXON_ID=0 /ORGANISM="Stereomyxa ramosa, Strain Chinc5" /LENGTH=271 /DNA_ID=CAMNT_0015352319 /DNA_START=770 /DNA_END=1583 /DNA_ORIENTATION=+